MRNRTIILTAASLSILSVGSIAQAGTLAYWNFDQGAVDAQVAHGTPDGIFDGTVPDLSGNNNSLSTWNASWAGFAYKNDRPTMKVPNSLSIKNTGGSPAAYHIDRNGLNGTGVTPSTLTTGQFPAFTVEASYKPETGGYRTVVGRDARDVANVDGDGDGALAALYLQIRPNDAVGVLFNDVSGKTHEAFSAPGYATPFEFNWPTDPNGLLGSWMNLAAVSDGTMLKMYVNGTLVASTDMTLSGSANTALASGLETDTGNDWYSGGWSVGRGLYNGGHGDRGYGFIDEVRISDHAVGYGDLLMQVPEPASALALGMFGLVARRRR
jgi:hypothetical protein